MTGETLVHAEDIRRPLGIAHADPIDALSRVANFYRESNLLIGGKDRLAGLTLRATDTDWTTGSGPEVRRQGAAGAKGTTGDWCARYLTHRADNIPAALSPCPDRNAAL
jgi:hypothetical protein